MEGDVVISFSGVPLHFVSVPCALSQTGNQGKALLKYALKHQGRNTQRCYLSLASKEPHFRRPSSGRACGKQPIYRMTPANVRRFLSSIQGPLSAASERCEGTGWDGERQIDRYRCIPWIKCSEKPPSCIVWSGFGSDWLLKVKPNELWTAHFRMRCSLFAWQLIICPLGKI